MGCFIEVHGGGYPIVVAHFLGPLAIKRPDRSGIPGVHSVFPSQPPDIFPILFLAIPVNQTFESRVRCDPGEA